jgi:DNA processing protein
LSDQKRYWIGFNLVKGIGAARFRLLQNAFGDLAAAWEASPQALRHAGLGPKSIETLVKVRSSVSLEMIEARIEAQGIQVLTWDEDDYPHRLKEIDQPPPVLYVRGTLCPEDEWAVAVVGTRKVTAYGRQVAEEVTLALAGQGVTVVSGLARGVDSVAHAAALNAGGRTLAVLGSGVDRVYPPENRPLGEKIARSGALISDYAPGTEPDGANFPARNRIISGLSLATVVVEAGERSGALITARFAADQGREVFAVPGSITAPQSVGTNRLIQQGARPLLDIREVLETLNLTRVTEHRAARKALPGDPTEAKLLSILRSEPQHVDEIRHLADLPIEQVSAALALMELKGMVRQVGGMQYVVLREAPASYAAGGPETSGGS